MCPHARLLLVPIVLGALVPLIGAQVPRGYEVVQITDDSAFQRYVRINGRGQIVFAARLDLHSGNSSEIFLYDHGALTRLTSDNICDAMPDINAEGTIVWSRAIGPQGPYGPTFEIIMRRPDGVVTQLTHDAVDSGSARINRLNHVVWDNWIRGGCENSNSIIQFYDGQQIRTLSDANWCHQGASLNDNDWVVWERDNFCVEQWTSDILLYINGVTTIISPPDTFEAQVPLINNRAQVAWTFCSGWGRSGIQMWENGVATLLTDDGETSSLNNHGDVYFVRWYEQPETYQSWLYSCGRFYQLTDDGADHFNGPGQVNDAGEAAWFAGPNDGSHFDVRWLRRIRPDEDQASAPLQPKSIQRIVP
jgi:hypothetical protein